MEVGVRGGGYDGGCMRWGRGNAAGSNWGLVVALRPLGQGRGDI